MASETRPTSEPKWWLRPLAAVVISSLVGIVLFRWEWLLNSAGFHVSAERPGVIAFEYWIGIPIAALLGFVFSRGPEPLVAGISLMWGATTINHIAYIARHGVPNLWPVELALSWERSLFRMSSQPSEARMCNVASVGRTMPSNNAFERAGEYRGPRLAAAQPMWPAAQLGLRQH
jgi:hypothetical protein